VHTYLYWNW